MSDASPIVDADDLVADYLDRLAGCLVRPEGAAVTLDSVQRADLLAQIRAHISDARAALAVDTVEAVQAILDRLGTPEQITLAALDLAGADPAASVGGGPDNTTKHLVAPGLAGPDRTRPARPARLRFTSRHWYQLIGLLGLTIVSFAIPGIGCLLGLGWLAVTGCFFLVRARVSHPSR
jgi:hypothetical protein